MPPTPQNIAFVLVPGGFCPGVYWGKVASILQGRGYEVCQIDLPSNMPAEGGGPPATMFDDADHIRAAVSRFADAGKNVTLAGNSYGGFVVMEAVQGTTKADRLLAKKEVPGSLVHLVLIGTLLVPIGTSIKDLGDKQPASTDSKLDYVEPPDREIAGSVICSDLDEADQKHYGRMLRPQSAVSFVGRLTYAGYLHVPTTVVIPSRDKAVDPRIQHESVDAVIADGHHNIKKLVVESDHCAMISRPEQIVEILLAQPPTA